MKKVLRRLPVTFNGVPGESIAVVEIFTKSEYQNKYPATPEDARSGPRNKEQVIPKRAELAASAWSLGRLIRETGKSTLTIRDDFAGDKINLDLDELKLTDPDNAYLTYRVYFRPWDSPDPTSLPNLDV